jgi:phage gpG-like protein
MRITVDDSKAQRLLAGMQARSADMRPVLKDAGRLLEKANAANFTSSGLPVGGWSPRREPAAWPLMIRTGKLFQSLTNMRGAGSDIGLRSASFGTKVEYAKFHQNGTRKMPKRLIVFEPVGFKAALEEKAANHIIGMRARLFN